MELLVYLGISSMVMLGSTLFLVQTTKIRLSSDNQKLTQHSSRLALEKMTLSLRNAYDVVVSADGTRATIYSYNFNDPGRPIVSVYCGRDGQLWYGQSFVIPPDDGALSPVIEAGVKVSTVQFNKVSASLHVRLNTVKNDRESSIESTIAFRQK
ncbi:MAG: hypothetical protein WCT27_04165 [Patescibacteria group bacterium]